MHDRRVFLRNCASFSAFALVAELSAAATQPASLSGRRWISHHRDLARDLQTGALSQVQWHERVNSLARDIDLEQLAAELRRARIKDAGQESYLIQPIDPLGGQLLPNGSIRAPIISFERSMELYTAQR